ncbi:hypothetical protein [Streptomyces scopuliridis]|uniref:hypothetical protein n=1 Tax=Streptomyces scopuliridis TaxID=452529 RepID=UPI00105784F7|nr:hypothetical protein [Streptomyces scopuliridis]
MIGTGGEDPRGARVRHQGRRGQDWNFRRRLAQYGLGYAVAVPKSQQIKSLAGIRRIAQLIDEAPARRRVRHFCGCGGRAQIAGGFCDEYRDAREVVIGAKAEGHEPTPVGPVTRDDT